MKKLIALLCMLTCIFSLTACGKVETENVFQADKQANAESYAVETLLPVIAEMAATQEVLDIYNQNGYTFKEWETVIYNSYNVSVDGAAFLKGLDSFLTGLETMGEILSTDSVSSKVSDEEIIVYVDVIGLYKNGQFEIILSNDYFTELKSCTLNVDATFKELMTTAALNTLLGMGTVFSVLVFIMLVIYAFGLIPKLQAAFANKGSKQEAPKKETKKTAAKEEDLALVAAMAATAAYEESKNDTELVAVIAAAVAAYRGETSTDGFVVRSIKKMKRR